MTEFVRIPKNEWRLHDNAGLIHWRRYDDIISKLARESIVVKHKREQAKGSNGYYRARIMLRADPLLIAGFHSSPCGYRAQYYSAIEIGELATAYALQKLISRVGEFLIPVSKRTCPWSWVEGSLLDSDAKLWIHQGLWLRRKKLADRNLSARNWVWALSAIEEIKRKKAVWATLTPREECLIEIKGGFINLDGDKLGTLKQSRSGDLHNLGFT